MCVVYNAWNLERRGAGEVWDNGSDSPDSGQISSSSDQPETGSQRTRPAEERGRACDDVAAQHGRG